MQRSSNIPNVSQLLYNCLIITPFILMKIISSLLALATSAAFLIPLSLGNTDALCQSTGNGGYKTYTQVRPDLHGVPQTLTFREDIQSKFCRVASFEI